MGNNAVANIQTNSRFNIKKSTIEWWITSLIFVFSLINNTTLLVSLISLGVLFKQKEIGAIKVLNILTLRTVMNPGLAANIGNFQELKWLFIFMSSFYLIYGYNKIDTRLRSRINGILISVTLFAVYNILSSFFLSTLPTIAIFRVFSYIIPFIGVMIGIANTSGKFDLINWIHRMFSVLFIGSIPFSFLPVGYLRNGRAFQGLTNQPNMFGILCALFIALILTKIQLKGFKSRWMPFLQISVLMYMIILSESRTGFISAVTVIMMFLLFSNMIKIKKIIIFNFSGIVMVVYIWLHGGLLQELQEFLSKGHDDILHSRSGQVDGLMANFLRNPLFGSGFSVPVTQQRSFQFSFDYVIEPGNLILAVLSYGGIVGLALFINYILKIFMVNKSHFKLLAFLPVSTLLISMGEMVFFSTNNIAIWLYMFISIYIMRDNGQSAPDYERRDF